MGNNIEKGDDAKSENEHDGTYIEYNENKNYVNDLNNIFPFNFEYKIEDDYSFANNLSTIKICDCCRHLDDNFEGPVIKRQIKFNYNNIINKLNAHFFNNFMIDLIQNNSIKKDILLKKVSHSFIAKLNKKNTERILNMKISDIFYEQEISPKYRINMKNYNKNLIDKIYEEKKERNVIKILELTFEELFIIFRRKLNDSEDMKKLEEIKNKIKGLDLLENNDKYKDIQYLIKNIKNKSYYTVSNDYIENIKKVCLDYEKRLYAKNNKNI